MKAVLDFGLPVAIIAIPVDTGGAFVLLAVCFVGCVGFAVIIAPSLVCGWND